MKQVVARAEEETAAPRLPLLKHNSKKHKNKQTNKQTKQTKNIKNKEYTEYVVRNKDKFYIVACKKTSLACIASVSARVNEQKLEREQTNKRKGRGSGSKFSRHNSSGNAGYAGKGLLLTFLLPAYVMFL